MRMSVLSCLPEPLIKLSISTCMISKAFTRLLQRHILPESLQLARAVLKQAPDGAWQIQHRLLDDVARTKHASAPGLTRIWAAFIQTIAVVAKNQRIACGTQVVTTEFLVKAIKISRTSTIQRVEQLEASNR